MSKYYYDITQHSDEWFGVKRGKFSGSNFAKLMMAKSTKGYNDLINGIVYERLTGITPESYSNKAMERGTELEPFARGQYELDTFNKVKEVGFAELNEFVGCSPDGLIGEDGVLEIKCPLYNTFINYALNSLTAYNDYKWQLQGNLWATERLWIDFYIYHPNLRPLLNRIDRDEKSIDKLAIEIELAIGEVKNRIERLKNG